MKITVTRTAAPKVKPDYTKLGFGKYFTDHMFIMDYTEGQGWHDARIEPYHDLSLSPAAMVFHYAQEMFEGLKAYRTADGRTLLFRPQKNIERMNNTNRRLCIPQIDPDDALQAIVELVRTDIDWVPTENRTGRRTAGVRRCISVRLSSPPTPSSAYIRPKRINLSSSFRPSVPIMRRG